MPIRLFKSLISGGVFIVVLDNKICSERISMIILITITIHSPVNHESVEAIYHPIL